MSFLSTASNKMMLEAHFRPMWLEWDRRVKVIKHQFNLRPNTIHGWQCHILEDLRFRNSYSLAKHYAVPVEWGVQHSLAGDSSRHCGDLVSFDGKRGRKREEKT